MLRRFAYDAAKPAPHNERDLRRSWSRVPEAEELVPALVSKIEIEDDGPRQRHFSTKALLNQGARRSARAPRFNDANAYGTGDLRRSELIIPLVLDDQ